MDIKVSICIITYNQEKYIAQAIESALMQQTNFSYEIVIGEDCSTDKTREIVKEYAEKNPDKIRLLLHPHNLGLYGKHNFAVTLKECKGEYVALLEGDDYWISKDKLQKQVDFLDANLDFTSCFHAAEVINECENKKYIHYGRNREAVSTIDDLIQCIWFMPTASVVFRNRLFEWPRNFLTDRYISGDNILHFINAHYGKIYYIDEVMSVYNIHKTGLGRKLKDQINIYVNDMVFLSDINIYFNYKYDKQIKPKLMYNICKILNTSIENSNYNDGKKYLKEYRHLLTYRSYIIYSVKLYTPLLYKIVKLLYKIVKHMVINILNKENKYINF